MGGTTGYVGFTGGTGGLTAIQDILTWTYVVSSGGSPQQVATPTFSPAAGTYTAAQLQSGVSISDTTTGALIYYTTGGSTPTTSSTQYSGPIAVGSTTTIKAIAAASGMTNSAVATATYTIQSSRWRFSELRQRIYLCGAGTEREGRHQRYSPAVDRRRVGRGEQRVLQHAGQRANFHQRLQLPADQRDS